MAIMASKGAVASFSFVSAGEEVRSRAEVEPRRSVAERGEEWEDWIWEAEKSLGGGVNWCGFGGVGEGWYGMGRGDGERRGW